MKKSIRYTGVAALLCLSFAPAHAAYVKNDPINNIDPTGECTTNSDGESVGVCPTDIASAAVLETTKLVSPETAQADAMAESQGVNVPYTFQPGRTGSVTSSLTDSGGNTIAQNVIVGGSSYPVAAVDTETGENIAYTLNPIESTAHEVGGHVLSNLSGPQAIGMRDPQTPNSEVPALAAENNLRNSLGVPVQRQVYEGRAPVVTTPTGPRPPRTIYDYAKD